MYISKAIKKQKSSLKWFLSTMITISIVLPLILLLFGRTSIFYIGYLLFLEILIAITILITINNAMLDFECFNNKLKIKSGLFRINNYLVCDKVVLVHTEGKNDEMEIIIITTLRVRNKIIRPITKSFFKKYPYVAGEYKKLKEFKPDNQYYYTVIKRGALKKYLLLDIIYRNCVKAIYTNESIENIKIARGQKELYNV